MSVVKNFPILYKKTSTGAIQKWCISVHQEDDEIQLISTYGQVDGKNQTSIAYVREGKNIGKANETTALKQGLLDAESDHKRHLKKGYVDNYEDAQNGVIDAIIEGGIFPMLAHKFSEQGHKIKYPALAQPKLDGNRAVYQGVDDTLWSRTRKPINSVPHIIKAIKDSGIDVDYLDGELYSHDYRDRFEELTSYIRQESPTEGHEVVEYHVYDFPHPTLTNQERNILLQSFKPLFKNTPIHIVETIIVNNEEELMEAFEHFLAEGYEGCIVRNADGLYVNKRSYDLQKVKEFEDSEFKIVGVKVGDKGSMAGKAVFVCETEDGTLFSAKLIGNMELLAEYAKTPELVIGKILTVKYQGRTNKNNVPRFPVAMRFREDI